MGLGVGMERILVQTIKVSADPNVPINVTLRETTDDDSDASRLENTSSV